ncbi:MAG TPA: glycosyltransferase [Tahibacter sp.]|uniref:glycosyltransferase n=1 Tax=Tahibacter sp. TaxID=2056211 RepID=UPI002CF96D86|nr:glycosyltransferase [Tahibacter sp.]HSX60979.1 glycosyltransferase [Tahibacter sp.]
MRVLHIGKFYPPAAGGIETFTAMLARAQAAAGDAVAVLAHAERRSWRTRQRADGTIAVHEVARWGQLAYAPLSPGFPWQLARAIASHRPDVLHIHVPNTSAFAALLVPAARRLPWIVHWHADIPLDSASRALRLAYPFYRPWEQALLRRADAIIATSSAYRDASHALADWRAKTTIVPLALDDAPAVPPGETLWPPGKRRLLAVGRLSHYKGFEVLLDSVAQLPDTSLLLIGSGERERALRTRIAELGLQSRVRMTGHVDDDTLRGAYAAAEIFCLPSLDRAEAFGMVLLEAMRAGLPCVASAIVGSGVGEVVAAGTTGLLTPPGDADALAAALDRLSNDEELCRRFGTAGRERWQNDYRPAAVSAATRQVYAQALAHRAAADRSG